MKKQIPNSRTTVLAFAAIAMSLGVTSMTASAANVVLDGGSSWVGWTSEGQSNQLGVYGSGATTDVYEVYATTFYFDNNSVDFSGGAVGGGPTGGVTGFGTGAFSTGAFANGNVILGIGVRRISGSTITGPNVRFDLDSDSYLAATSVGGSDGRASSSTYSEFKDFTVQFNSSTWAGSTLNAQAGTGTFYGGPNNFQTIPSGVGSGVSSDYAFRAFGLTDSYQMLFDVDAMQTLYGGVNPFGLNPSFPGIGAFGSTVRISLNGVGTNNAVFDAPVLVSVPEPSMAMLLGIGCTVTALRRRRSA